SVDKKAQSLPSAFRTPHSPLSTPKSALRVPHSTFPTSPPFPLFQTKRFPNSPVGPKPVTLHGGRPPLTRLRGSAPSNNENWLWPLLCSWLRPMRKTNHRPVELGNRPAQGGGSRVGTASSVRVSGGTCDDFTWQGRQRSQEARRACGFSQSTGSEFAAGGGRGHLARVARGRSRRPGCIRGIRREVMYVYRR